MVVLNVKCKSEVSIQAPKKGEVYKNMGKDLKIL